MWLRVKFIFMLNGNTPRQVDQSDTFKCFHRLVPRESLKNHNRPNRTRHPSVGWHDSATESKGTLNYIPLLAKYYVFCTTQDSDEVPFV